MDLEALVGNEIRSDIVFLCGNCNTAYTLDEKMCLEYLSEHSGILHVMCPVCELTTSCNEYDVDNLPRRYMR